jgi:polysaccharide export outer membrane protein
MLILVLLALMVAPTVRAQQEATDFTRTFEVFMQSRDAYRLFDVSPEDVIYSLPASYTIGPGDILQVIMTGMINDALMVQVGPQGDIYVPPSGLLVVEGMTVGEARDYIDEELSQYLINYDLSLQLLRARRIKVYLLGQVRQPGTYIALAGTTALSLIQTAGSLIQNPQSIDFVEPDVTHPYFRALTSGAGRWLEIFRDGERVGRMDLAQVAIRGRAQGDVVLQDGDALYISPNDHPVVVRGGVARPGTYEIRGNDTVFDVLAQAGGYRNMMMLDTVYVERQVAGSDETEMIELDLTDPDFHAREFTFQPGDILRVPEVRDQVYVLGGVWMPQAIDYHEGWNALDYIAAAGGPTAPADDSAIRIVGFPLTDDQRVTAFDFKNLYMDQPVESVPIEPGDLIYVPWENQPFYGVGITNAIATILGQTLGILRIIKDIG